MRFMLVMIATFLRVYADRVAHDCLTSDGTNFLVRWTYGISKKKLDCCSGKPVAPEMMLSVREQGIQMYT
jgi:hypothetical protein